MTEPSLASIQKQLDELLQWKKDLVHTFDMLSKQIDDVAWYHKVGDVAEIDKVRLLGPPHSEYMFNKVREITERTMPSYGLVMQPEDEIVIPAYTFKPKNLDEDKKYPLMVLPHGGIHWNFACNDWIGHYAMVRELIEQGYIIVAPEYRGSTGYGLIFFHSIDEYLLPEDTYACRNWMLENCDQVDPGRIGIMGHSHGGYNTLFNVFRHPKAYHAAYAGVPMSDMFIRLNYHLGFYDTRERHSGGRIGDQWAIRDRSPAWNVESLETPLLIHAATNDRDVFITEVESLIVHLKAAGKEFEYKAYEDAPGGHLFEYIDTAFAKAARREAYRFLARYLKPENPP